MTNKKLLAGILGILLVFSFVLISCGNDGGGSSVPDLSAWKGTWNAVDQYMDNAAFNKVWTDAIAAIKAARPDAVVDAATLKGLTKQLLKTDFKSCVIEGNMMKIYDSPNAAGSPAETITYAYAGIHTVENEEWLKFTGNTTGQFKYLVLGPTEQDDPDAMLHFHLQYSATSFEAATGDNPDWEAMVTPSTTPVAKMAEDIATFPWAAYADFFVPKK